MSLSDDIFKCKKLLAEGHLKNEAMVSQAIVLRCLGSLGWPIFEPQVVASEYRLEDGRRADFALLDAKTNPLVLIEVKRSCDSRLTKRDEEQVFDYAYECDASQAVLTNGYEWKFYLPLDKQGSREEQCKYQLNLARADTQECATILRRYLSYDDVCSGASLKNLRRDYGGPSRNRLIQETLPRALESVLRMKDEHDDLVASVGIELNSLCGYWPDDEVIKSFIAEHLTFEIKT